MTSVDASPPSVGYRDLLRNDLARLTVGAFLLMICNAFEIVGSASAMPAVLEDLGGVGFYGWAISAPLIASLVSAPFGGRLADRFGTRLPVAIGLAVFALGLTATAVAPSMPVVAAGRFVQGLGAGALTTLGLVIVARRYPVSLRPRMLALVSAAFILPGLIGPALAAAIASTVGWRWVYGGIVPVLAFTAVLLLPQLHGRAQEIDGDAHEEAGFPWWGPVAMSLGIALAVAGLASTNVWLLPLGVAGVAFGVLGGRATLPKGTWQARRGTDAAVGQALAGSAAYLTYEAFLPLLLVEVRGQSLLRAALPLTAAAICWTGGSWWQARADATRRPALARTGAGLLTVGLVMGASLLWDAVPFWMAYPATAVASFGMGLAFTIDQVVAVEWAPPGREGWMSSSVQVANLLGAAIGTSVSAVAVAWFADSLPFAIGLTFVFTISCAVAATWAGGRLPAGLPPVREVPVAPPN